MNDQDMTGYTVAVGKDHMLAVVNQMLDNFAIEAVLAAFGFAGTDPEHFVMKIVPSFDKHHYALYPGQSDELWIGWDKSSCWLWLETLCSLQFHMQNNLQ